MVHATDQLAEYENKSFDPAEYSHDDLEFDDPDEESNPDWDEDEEGNVTMYDGDEKENNDLPFDGNLAELMDSHARTQMGQALLELIEIDKADREPHDKKYAEGIRRSGLGDDSPGGSPFDGASVVTHPILTECSIDFMSAAMKEIHPPNGPVKTKIMGQMTPEKRLKSERKKDFMNWQLTDQIEEYPTEIENLLMQLPFSGSQYLSLFQDRNLNRPSVELITSDRVYLPYGTSSFYQTERLSIKMEYMESEIADKIDAGEWIDTGSIAPSQLPERSRTQEAQNRVEGVDESSYNEDGLKVFYRIFLWKKLECDDEADGERAPYVMLIDSETGEIPLIRRNWEEGDPLKIKLDHIVEFKFFPWKGPYGIGFTHMIGGLSAAMTGALRALLDTAHINNFPALLKMKSKAGGQSITMEATGVTEIEGTSPVDDIRKLIMAVPYNPPSTVLFQLLGWLDGIAKGVVTTAEEKIADASNNGPVGTTLALIEQGSKVYANIHARLHRAIKKCLQILHRINKEYLDDKVTIEELGDLIIHRKDFEGPMDIIPVSDPHIFSESQRYAQLQAVRQLRTQEPDLFNRKALVRRELQQLRVDNFEELLVPDPKPIKANPVAENIMMAKGRPAVAFPEQDHLAHIKVLITFMKDPNLGASPIIGPKYMPLAIQHLAEHIILWYGIYVYQTMGQMVGPEFQNYLKMDQLSPKIDRVLGLITEEIHQKMGITMKGVPEEIQQAQKLLASYHSPSDPNVMEVQRKKQRDQMDFQHKDKKLALDTTRTKLKHQVDQSRIQVSTDEIKQKGAEVDGNLASGMLKDTKDNQTKITVAQIMAHSKIKGRK